MARLMLLLLLLEVEVSERCGDERVEETWEWVELVMLPELLERAKVKAHSQLWLVAVVVEVVGGVVIVQE